MRALLCAFLLVLPRSANAQWRTALTASADALIFEDVAQSLWGRHHGGGEANPLLGHAPSDLVFQIAGVTCIVGNTFAPRSVRPFVNVATIAVESYFVWHNFHVVPVDGATRIGWRWHW